MNVLLQELKVRARIRLNAMRRGDAAMRDHMIQLAKKARQVPPREWKLGHALNLVAAECGFRTWEHARDVFGGQARLGDDMGAFWHDGECHGLLNHWFSSYADALSFVARDPSYVVLPYRRHFVAGDDHYVRALKMEPDLSYWNQASRDLVRSYGSAAWMALCLKRLRGMSGEGRS